MQKIFSLWVSVITLAASNSALAAYTLEVQPIAVYDSRWNGSVLGAVGSNLYLPNVNGAYAPTFETRVDAIYSQCMIDVSFSPTVSFDTATSSFDYLNLTDPNHDRLLRTSPNGVDPAPSADPVLEAFINSLSSTAHYMFFVNSHPNTPAGGTTADPMSGGIAGTGASGVAVTPSAGGAAPMRSYLAHSNDITAGNESSFNDTNLPTVLAHELAHNLSLTHVAATSNLMYTGNNATGTQDFLTSEQCDAARTTGVNNLTLTAVPEPSPFLALASVATIFMFGFRTHRRNR